MNKTLRAALCVAGLVAATSAAAQVTFYAREGFRGPSFTADGPVRNFEREGFNDMASSAVVRGGAWQVCEDARFIGNCVVLQPGQYESLQQMGLNNAISSVRPVDQYGSNYQGQRLADNDRYVDRDRYARRGDERLFDVPVTEVHAVVGPPQQRCWVEREQVGQGGGGANVPGAVAGAAIGGNVNRTPEGVVSQDVQRCDYVPANARPDYWDVTYNFRGMEHHVQMSSPPGATITVTADGEPRM